MNVVRNAEAVFVGTVVLAVAVAAAAPFLGLTHPDQAPRAEPHRVSQLVSVPSVPVVIVRGKRLSADEKAQAAPDKPAL
ncbi:hypothetical protein [Massilia sp. YMA4]|uniref:Uncharacterized protein n=1 Tax=[Empedobacter] haloabium TaxID=592317 RepID=A0ABZ1UTG0_9BURK|nr:hypothetical protein [Massilia sp. YMA4]AXA91186.1 hypothetical protein DPH57_08460 [Massilia sp. YMA4]